MLLKAGSRFEPKAGAAHILQNFSFKSTAKRSSLGTVRETELHGGTLSASLTREHLALTADFLREDAQLFVDILAAFLTSAKFTRHELHEYVLPNVAQDTALALADPRTHALEVAHSLAFRTGLGASLFAKTHDSVTEDDIRSFARASFAPDRVAIVGAGLSAAQLGDFLQSSLGKKEATHQFELKTSQSKYFGGETRVAAHGGPQTVFIGFGTAGAGGSAELATLAAYLSPTPSIKWPTGAARVAGEALPEGTKVESIYFPYSDAALFGFVVQATNPTALREAGQVVVESLKKVAKPGAVAEGELAKAVAKAKFSAASAVENRDGLALALGTKILSNEPVTIDANLAAFSAVSASSLYKAAVDLTSRKPTYIAVGDINTLPYADELGL